MRGAAGRAARACCPQNHLPLLFPAGGAYAVLATQDPGGGSRRLR